MSTEHSEVCQCLDHTTSYCVWCSSSIWVNSRSSSQQYSLAT